MPAGSITAYAANYVLQVDSTLEAARSLEALPSSPNFVEEGQSVQTPKEVEWEVSEGSFLDAGSYVTAKYTIKENGQTGTVQVTAIPDNVVYLVESNRVSEDAGDYGRLRANGMTTALKNEVPDQAYADGSWGYVDSGLSRKGNVSSLYGTKGYTGYYAAAGVTYKLPLEAGTYTVSAPIYEWWGNYGRSVDVTAEFTYEGEMQHKVLGTGKPTVKNESVLVEGSFTIDTDQTVSLHFNKSPGTGQDPVVSGFTVIRTDAELPVPDGSIPFTLDGSRIDPVNTFGGFGAVTCNNTSRLLLDYKEDSPDQYWEMMRLLFDPEDGAGLHHVKIEMGADVNSSSGTEPATMRSPDEEPNVNRGAGFHFAADAKTINPEITVELLRWGEPKWTQEGIGSEDAENPRYEARYQWYRKTVDAVYETYGYRINEVSPGQNERQSGHADDFTWIKYCARRFNEDGEAGVGAYDYRDIKIVAADLYRGMNTTVSYLTNDPEFRDLVDVISDHYAVNLGSADLTRLNQEYGIKVIYGEGIAPMINADYRYHAEPEKGGVGGSTGMADLAERFIAAYSYQSSTGHPSRMTSFLYQPAIGGFYEGSAYSPKQLIGAFDPWSGYYEADGGLQMTRHFMLFADQDWQYLPDACYADGNIGDGGMVYNTSTDVRMAVKDPQTDDYSVMFANNTTQERSYTIRLKNLATAGAAYNVWETAGPQDSEAYDAGWFQKIADRAVPETDGNGDRIIRLTVKPHSIVTLTTLTERGTAYQAGDNAARDDHGEKLERSVLKLPYRDDFDYSDSFVEERGGTPKYTTDLEGAFEVVPAADAPGYILQQQINNTNRPYTWNPWGGGSDESSQTTGIPWTVMGDHRWANYKAGIDFKLDLTSEGYGDNFAVLGVRELVHSSGAAYRGRVYADGTWQLLRFGSVMESGRLEGFAADSWHKLQIEAKEAVITMYLDGIQLCSYTDQTGSAVLTGRVVLMSGFWNTAFDNLEILPVEGYSDSAVVKADDTSPLLTYGGNVSHAVGEGYAHYNRTRTTMSAGSSLEFDLPEGMGFDVFGNSAGASIQIRKDGAELEAGYRTGSTGNRETSYWNQSGLGSGRISIKVLSGSYTVDGVNLFGPSVSEQPELVTDHLDGMIAYAEGLDFSTGDYPEELVGNLTRAVAGARAVRDSSQNQTELDLAALLIRNAVNGIVPGDTITGLKEPLQDLVIVEGEVPGLPETVTAVNAMRQEIELPVAWELDEEQLENPWAAVVATGTAEGMSTKLSVRIQVVPAGLTHFIDSGTVNVINEDGETGHSAVYDLIAAAQELQNDRSDRVYAAGQWGYINDSMAIKSGDSVTYQTDIYTSGLYVGSGKDIIYKLPLAAGTYTLMTGYQAYWNEQRTMDISVVYPDQGTGQDVEIRLGSATVNTSNNNIYHEGSFEIPQDCEVAIHVGKNPASKDPVLSWLAIVDESLASYRKVVVNEDLPLLVEKSGTDLPETLNISYQGETGDLEVNWRLTAGDLTGSGTTVTYTGTFDEIPGKKITWSPLVYSKHLVYMIDAGIMIASGSPGESAVYNEIAALADLKNQVPDQPLAGNDWGYSGIDGSKAYEAGHGLHATGFYGENAIGSSFTYQIILDEGDYQINTGHTEWWTQNRGTQVDVSYPGPDGEVVRTVLGKVNWSNGTRWAEGTLQGTISIPRDGTVVTVTFTAADYNQGAVVSYLMVEAVPEVVMTGIKVHRLPNKLIYQIGEELDTAGMVVTATRSNAQPVELTAGQYTVSELDSSEAGRKKITVSAIAETGETYSDSFFVTVSELEYYTSRIIVTTRPDKTVYYVDEAFEPAGMEVKAIRRATASNAEAVEEVIGDYVTEYDFSTAGEQMVTILYHEEDAGGELREFRASFKVTVREYPVEDDYYTTGIYIYKKPVKLIYRVSEGFDPEGLEVKAVKKATASDAALEEFLDTDVLEYEYDFSTPGTKTVKIIYTALDRHQEEKEFRTTLRVSVAAVSEAGYYTKSIKVTSPPVKTEYRVGDPFNRTGMVVKAVRVNEVTGELSEVEITDYQVSIGVFMLKGNQKIQISYTAAGANGDLEVFTDSFYVSVKPAFRESSGSTGEAGGETVIIPHHSMTQDTVYGSWKQDDAGWWFAKRNGGWPASEWARINGLWYYFDRDGYMMKETWLQFRNYWYYLGPEGNMYTSRWLLYGGEWYYLGADGIMASDTRTPDGYEVDQKGRWEK